MTWKITSKGSACIQPESRQSIGQMFGRGSATSILGLFKHHLLCFHLELLAEIFLNHSSQIMKTQLAIRISITVSSTFLGDISPRHGLCQQRNPDTKWVIANRNIIFIKLTGVSPKCPLEFSIKWFKTCPSSFHGHAIKWPLLYFTVLRRYPPTGRKMTKIGSTVVHLLTLT